MEPWSGGARRTSRDCFRARGERSTGESPTVGWRHFSGRGCGRGCPGFISRGERASGAGRPDGGTFGPARIGSAPRRLGFDEAVPPNGYAWWYVDAFSADHRFGLTIIAFIGSVFSPYYASQRRLRGRGRPGSALFAQRCGLWARRGPLGDDRALRKGFEAQARWAHHRAERCHLGRLKAEIEIDEKAPLTMAPLRGTVTLEPEILTGLRYRFRHWRPPSLVSYCASRSCRGSS